MHVTAALLLVSLVAICGGEPLYINEWAVQVPGGEQAANKVAKRHGFENRGQVKYENVHVCECSAHINLKRESVS